MMSRSGFQGAAKASGGGLDHDGTCHVRMQGAEILVVARCRERERELVLRIERLRLEELAAGGDRVWDVIVVDPGNGCASLHGDALRREGELVNSHLRVR